MTLSRAFAAMGRFGILCACGHQATFHQEGNGW